MSVLTDGYNCENKNVHVRGEESKLITRHHSGRAWDSNPGFVPRAIPDRYQRHYYSADMEGAITLRRSYLVSPGKTRLKVLRQLCEEYRFKSSIKRLNGSQYVSLCAKPIMITPHAKLSTEFLILFCF